jgi:drug/metabolite transporter (DMT)-like permease
MQLFGVLFAVTALVSWAIADFLIQRVTRKVGDVKTLFYISVFGLVVLFPFVAGELPALSHSPRDIFILSVTTALMLGASLFDFEALKEGKFAVIEPIYGMELPFTIALSLFFWHEKLSLAQSLLMLMVFAGMILAITKHRFQLHYHKRFFEKGVLFALVGSFGFGVVNFVTGVAAQTVSPLMTIWFISLGTTLLCGAHLFFHGQLRTVTRDIRLHWRILVVQGIFDNGAWVAFCYAVLHLPISIATIISNSYIGLGVLLGIFLNHERVRRHQVLGIILIVVGVVVIGAITPEAR